MDLSVDYLVDLSEAWLPVALQYGAQVTLALLTFLFGWWLINYPHRQSQQSAAAPSGGPDPAWLHWQPGQRGAQGDCCWSAWHR